MRWRYICPPAVRKARCSPTCPANMTAVSVCRERPTGKLLPWGPARFLGTSSTLHPPVCHSGQVAMPAAHQGLALMASMPPQPCADNQPTGTIPGSISALRGPITQVQQGAVAPSRCQ